MASKKAQLLSTLSRLSNLRGLSIGVVLAKADEPISDVLPRVVSMAQRKEHSLVVYGDKDNPRLFEIAFTSDSECEQHELQPVHGNITVSMFHESAVQLHNIQFTLELSEVSRQIIPVSSRELTGV